MPTPFTHLASAQRLLDDEGWSAPGRAFLHAHASAFLLGSIAADGHACSALRREDTHFYTYDRPITTPPSAIMLTRYPALVAPDSAGQRAFVAGYIGHLALDEAWTERVTRPYFIEPAWGSSAERLLMLNVLLAGMDERDRHLLRPNLMAALPGAVPAKWLPFLPDAALIAWRDQVASQLEPGAPSQTLPIVSARTATTVEALRELIHSDEAQNTRLWAHVPRIVVEATEAHMQDYARDLVGNYLDGVG
ncbi:MAG: hypothetical protein JNL34_15450 [Anaerolineae bacterium]|nr:hypothetical protein [Anaerolineae bacterium]